MSRLLKTRIVTVKSKWSVKSLKTKKTFRLEMIVGVLYEIDISQRFIKKETSHTQNTQSFSIALNTDKSSVFTCHGQSKTNWKQDNTSKHFVLVLSVSIIIAAADIYDNCQMDLMDFGFWVNCSNECGVHLFMQWWEWRWDWVEGEYVCVCAYDFHVLVVFIKNTRERWINYGRFHVLSILSMTSIVT